MLQTWPIVTIGMKTTRTLLPLTPEELLQLKRQNNHYRIAQYVAWGLLPVCGVLFFWKYYAIASILLFVLVVGIATLSVLMRHTKKDMEAGVKTELIGPVESLVIRKPGCTITFEKMPESRVRISVKTPGGFEEYDQPLVLGAGERDLFFYTVVIDGESIDVSRGQFFRLDQGNTVRIAFTSSKKVLEVENV